MAKTQVRKELISKTGTGQLERKTSNYFLGEGRVKIQQHCSEMRRGAAVGPRLERAGWNQLVITWRTTYQGFRGWGNFDKADSKLTKSQWENFKKYIGSDQ
jgi:hypothetical protein